LTRAWQVLFALCLAFAALPVQAQSVIRDAEIENALGRIASPILRAAGMGPGQVDIYIVNDPDLNAYVAGGNNIFLHSGLLRKLETIDQLQAVIAHEVAHITGGHLARRNEKIRQAQRKSGIGAALALAAVVAGQGEVGLAAGLLSQEVALRDVLAHSRAEEAAADQAGLGYMVGAGADPRAIMEVMEIFRGQEILSERYVDPYVQTHPLWNRRIRLLEDRVASARQGPGRSQAEVLSHARMVAKFDGFLGNPRRTLNKYKDDKTEIGALARAVAYHRIPNPKRALATVDALLRVKPNDPYYHELRGQFLIESGRAAEAAKSYRHAARLAPNEPLILAGLGRALVALDTPAATQEALDVLTRAAARETANPVILRNLAVVHARQGRPGRASLATAERFALQGRLRDADIHAARAAGQLPEGSPGWRQAQDILRITRRAKK